MSARPLRLPAAVILSLVLAAGAACSGPPRPAADQDSLSGDSSAASPDTADRHPVAYWAHQLGRGTLEERRQALAALATYGDAAGPYVGPVAGLLQARDDSTGNLAAWTLGHLAPTGLAPLRSALHSSRPEVRRRAAYGLGVAGLQAQPALPDLQRALDKEIDPQTTRMINWAIGRIARLPTATRRSNPLLDQLSSTDTALRQEAIEQLTLAGGSSDIQLSLVTALGSRDSLLRDGAATTLLQIGPRARPALSAGLASPNPRVRSEAARLLARLQQARF